jgi:hypothetical protein
MGSQKTTGNRKATAIVAGVVMCGAVISLFFSFFNFPPAFNAKPHEAIGRTLASEAARLLGQGGRIILIARESSAFDNPATEVQLESFSRAARTAGATIAATNLMKVDPLRIVAVPPGEFLEILRKASENDVIASFLGPPNLAGAQRAKLSGKRTRVVAVCAGAMPLQVNLKRLFEEKLLDVAIISRRVVASTAPQADTPQGWFDHLFQIITTSNLGDLPPPAAELR